MTQVNDDFTLNLRVLITELEEILDEANSKVKDAIIENERFDIALQCFERALPKLLSDRISFRGFKMILQELINALSEALVFITSLQVERATTIEQIYLPYLQAIATQLEVYKHHPECPLSGIEPQDCFLKTLMEICEEPPVESLDEIEQISSATTTTNIAKHDFYSLENQQEWMLIIQAAKNMRFTFTSSDPNVQTLINFQAHFNKMVANNELIKQAFKQREAAASFKQLDAINLKFPFLKSITKESVHELDKFFAQLKERIDFFIPLVATVQREIILQNEYTKTLNLQGLYRRKRVVGEMLPEKSTFIDKRKILSVKRLFEDEEGSNEANRLRKRANF